GTARACDDDLVAGRLRALGKRIKPLGRAMRRDDALVVGNTERVERFGGVAHGGPVGLAPHDDRDGLGRHARALSPAPRMIPKSGHRFSEKIMRNKRRRGCIGIPPSVASRYVSLTLLHARWPLRTISGVGTWPERTSRRQALRRPKRAGRRTPARPLTSASRSMPGRRHAAFRWSWSRCWPRSSA